MIRIGILGCAEIAFRRFLPALMENKEFECVCIAAVSYTHLTLPTIA